MLDIQYANRSVENNIIKQTAKEVELIKIDVMTKSIHFSIWAPFYIIHELMIGLANTRSRHDLVI